MLPVFNCCWQFQPRLFAKPSSPIQQAPYLTLQRQAPKGKQAAQGQRGLAMPACSAGNISVYANSNILNISVNAEYRKKTKNPEIIMSTTLPGSWLMEELPLPPTAQESQGRAPASPKQLDLPLLSSNPFPRDKVHKLCPFFSLYHIPAVPCRQKQDFTRNFLLLSPPRKNSPTFFRARKEDKLR